MCTNSLCPHNSTNWSQKQDVEHRKTNYYPTLLDSRNRQNYAVGHWDKGYPWVDGVTGKTVGVLVNSHFFISAMGVFLCLDCEYSLSSMCIWERHICCSETLQDKTETTDSPALGWGLRKLLAQNKHNKGSCGWAGCSVGEAFIYCASLRTWVWFPSSCVKSQAWWCTPIVHVIGK